MGWRRCPRCKSGSVVKRRSKSLSKAVKVTFLFCIVSIFVTFGSGEFDVTPFEQLGLTIILLLIPSFFIFLYITIGRYLYCKSCELHFKPNKN